MAIGQQQTRVRKPVPAPTESGGQQQPLMRGRGFLHEVMVELKKTTWPSPKEAWRLTTVVLGVIISVALYIGVIDWVLTWATNYFRLIK